MRWIALPALLLSLLAAGCGGGSAETTTPVATRPYAGPHSRPDYIELADTICRNHQSRREDLESQASDLGPLTSKGKARQVAQLLRQESANRDAEVTEVSVLRPAAVDTVEVRSILSLVRAEGDVLDAWAKAYDELDAVAIRRLQIRLGLTAGKAADRARAYGFEVCGQH